MNLAHTAFAAPDRVPGSIHPLPGEAMFCAIIPGFLSAEECQAMIAQSEARGFASAGSDYPPSYRNNDRQVVDDLPLAQAMLARLRAYAPATLQQAGADGEAGTWTLAAINGRFRFCRYQSGQQFRIHQDGVHHRGPALRSCLTFMIYMTDGDDFEGGDTVFYAGGPQARGDGQAPVELGRVRPRAGSLILFDHRLWHAGATVSAGVKHIMRSDVLYASTGAPLRAERPGAAAHHGYVWTMAALADGGLASGGRDQAIRLWDSGGQARGALRGHTQSVLGLCALGPDRLASVSRDRSLRIWHVPSQACEVVVPAHTAAALAVAALPSNVIATGGADGLVRLWNADGTPLADLAGHTGWVWALAPIGDTMLASACEDGSVRVWNWRSGACMQVLHGDIALRSLAVSPSGREIVTGDIHGGIHTWTDTGKGWEMAGQLHAHDAAVRRVRFLDRATVASAGEDMRVRVWRWGSGEMLAQASHANFVTDVLALGDGAIVSCAYDGRIMWHSARMDTWDAHHNDGKFERAA